MGITQYESRDGIGVETTITLETGNVVTFRALNLEKERTGVHGKVFIGIDGVIMAWTRFNIDRDDERGRLFNKAFKFFPAVTRNVTDQADLHHRFDIFCKDAYKEWAGVETAGFMVPMEERTAPTFYIEPLVIKGGGTILFGPPGKGKSYVVMTIAAAVDNGVSDFFPVTQGRVLFVNLERSAESLQRRLLNVNEAMGIEEGTPLLTLNARGKTFDDVRDSIDDAIKEYKVKLVILDSISRAGMGDLNDNRPVNKIIDALNNTCETWIGLAHSPRGDATHVYGSVHFDAGADIVVQQVSAAKQHSLGVGLNIVKANDVSVAQPLTMLAFEFDSMGLTKVWKPSASDFPEITTATDNESINDKIYNLLMDIDTATTDTIADSMGISRSWCSTVMNKDTRFQKKKMGKEVYYSVKTQGIYS